MICLLSAMKNKNTLHQTPITHSNRIDTILCKLIQWILNYVLNALKNGRVFGEIFAAFYETKEANFYEL